ncbi:MAG TPA: UDP-N-acetylmuramoyl-L-alanyl-D-glutamate--2,6-diaminopimelate ligase, partial [Rhizobiales bacterium]|nr:UDP-N-acetylmuramoyl-L-alanyl-D-glutamate--2,6-diaminopimelate ligase [Hyphomicrobiales bacterium]
MIKTLQTVCNGLFDLDAAQGEIMVCGITCDSRKVKPGFVFAALAGEQVDGAKFAAKAAAAGAVAVVAAPDSDIDVPAHVVVLRHDQPRHALARMAAAFYASQPGCVVAVTGTNGKSSVVAFVRQMWQAMGLSGASLGTVGVTWAGGSEKLAHTTPDPVVLHDMLARLSARGISHLALEASSHGLEQNRLDGLSVCAGAFTNFSRDHLDYHETEDAYFAAKMRLFDDILEPGATAVVNMDSPQAEKVAGHAEKADL